MQVVVLERADRMARPFLKSPLGESMVPRCLMKVPVGVQGLSRAFRGASNLFFAPAPRKAYLNMKPREIANACCAVKTEVEATQPRSLRAVLCGAFTPGQPIRLRHRWRRTGEGTLGKFFDVSFAGRQAVMGAECLRLKSAKSLCFMASVVSLVAIFVCMCTPKMVL